MSDYQLLIDGASDARWSVILAHGAGQDMASAFMTAVAQSLAAAGDGVGGIRVVRFDFPYMIKRAADGRKRPPDRQPKLLACYEDVIAAVVRQGWARERLVIGGKSMGGRMASMLAADASVAGLVCLGYPFHPPARPGNLRTEHLETLNVPTLICQGERDPFGGKDEVDGFGLSEAIQFCWLPDGDHGFKPRKKSGYTFEENMGRAVSGIVAFVGRLGIDGDRPPGRAPT